MEYMRKQLPFASAIEKVKQLSHKITHMDIVYVGMDKEAH